VSDLCKWLHENLELLPLIRFPFKLECLPRNGICFFYEDGEIWGHGGNKPRIVRIGTHRGWNFRNRIAEHYLLDDRKMDFSVDKPKPSDRSVFRLNIGRALLNQRGDEYLQIWNKDFIKKENRVRFGRLRDINKEKEIEFEITRILRQNFSFRFIELNVQRKRMDKEGLESALIGTVAHCNLCKPSFQWLGNYSPKSQIRESGLWLVQHLKAHEINEEDKRTILNAINKRE